MPRPRINQDELAHALNLSRTTVSRSLSNHPAISAATRRRVQSMARKLGYHQPPTRAVRRARTHTPITFGVLVGRPLVPADGLTLPRIIEGIERRTRIDHAAIQIVHIDLDSLGSEACRREIFRHIRTGGWRGAILLYPFPPEVVAALSRKISVVSILTDYHGLRLDLIDADHDSVGTLVHRLHAAGHTRIGFIHWHYPAGGLWGLQRFAAYAQALFEAGLSLERAWTCNVHRDGPLAADRAAVAAHASRLIREQHVTAFVCAADHQAYALIEDLRAEGLECPRDYSVTGFDGNPAPRGLPTLTTLDVANSDLGASAVARLVSRLLAPTSPLRKTHVETAFTPGDTLGPPPALPFPLLTP